MSDWLDGEEFYEMMQAYRMSPVTDQAQTSRAFEMIKTTLRVMGGYQEVVERAFALEVLVGKFKEATMDMNSEKVAAAHEAAGKLGL